ncbi:MAG TPA: tRNA pseudouridine(38-40) synthase TruA [Opitutaceae bacterium]|jgi:tRNA pseudouridine38-40 synthase
MTRWKCVCAYDGGAFSGWQSQAGGGSVQDAIESRLAAIFQRPVRIHGSGRTDAGVHALGQVFHFDADWSHGPSKLAAAIAHRLSRKIQVASVRQVPKGFHARFSAKQKRYEYRLRLGDADPFVRPLVWCVPPDVDVGAMRKAAATLVGRHDFRAFSAAHGAEKDDPAGTVRSLRRLEVRSRGRAVHIFAEADGFLYKMVRSLVGGLVSVGTGRLLASDLKDCIRSGTRSPHILTAPPHGLFLTKVWYR